MNATFFWEFVSRDTNVMLWMLRLFENQLSLLVNIYSTITHLRKKEKIFEIIISIYFRGHKTKTNWNIQCMWGLLYYSDLDSACMTTLLRWKGRFRSIKPFQPATFYWSSCTKQAKIRNYVFVCKEYRLRLFLGFGHLIV